MFYIHLHHLLSNISVPWDHLPESAKGLTPFTPSACAACLRAQGSMLC